LNRTESSRLIAYICVLAITYDHIQHQNSFAKKCNSFSHNSIDNFHWEHFIIYTERTSKPFSILLTLGSMIIAYFLWQRFVTARTEWTIDKNGISMTWVRQFSFSHKDDISLKWNEIESIKRGFDPNYYNLKIRLVNGRKIKIYHDTLTTRDDFNQFIKILNQTFLTEKNSQQKTWQ